jgi:predicted GNAT family N-acyltransferase
MPLKIEVRQVSDPADLEKVFAIRREVFVVEQNCPPELEWEFKTKAPIF